MTRGIKSRCHRCGRTCTQRPDLVGKSLPICGQCRTHRDLTQPKACPCCGEDKPLADYLSPCGEPTRNCRACIDSGRVRALAAQKRLATIQANARRPKKTPPRIIYWPEISIPGDPFSGEMRIAG